MLGSDYDQGVVYYFKEAFEALGGTVISDDFTEGSSDFVSYINNAKAAGAGVIMAPVSTNYAQLIIEAAAAQGYEGELLGSDTWDNNKVIEAAKGTNVQIYVSTFYQEGGNAEFDAGIKEWINANEEALTNSGGNDMLAAVTVMGFDAYNVALEALKAAGTTDSKAVNEALWNVTHEGISGNIAFLPETGDAARDTAYIKVANTAEGIWDFAAVQGVA
jgi:branched-chain amino acid transport system substrate-binding protein